VGRKDLRALSNRRSARMLPGTLAAEQKLFFAKPSGAFVSSDAVPKSLRGRHRRVTRIETVPAQQFINSHDAAMLRSHSSPSRLYRKKISRVLAMGGAECRHDRGQRCNKNIRGLLRKPHGRDFFRAWIGGGVAVAMRRGHASRHPAARSFFDHKLAEKNRGPPADDDAPAAPASFCPL